MNQSEFNKMVEAAKESVSARLPRPGGEDITAAMIAKKLKRDMGFCNCDLDNWQPLRSTGHSSVCALHSLALKMAHPYDKHRAKLAQQQAARAEVLLAGLHHD